MVGPEVPQVPAPREVRRVVGCAAEVAGRSPKRVLRKGSAKDLHSQLQRFAEGAVAAAGPGLPVARECGVDLGHIEHMIEGGAGVSDFRGARERAVWEGGRRRGSEEGRGVQGVEAGKRKPKPKGPGAGPSGRRLGRRLPEGLAGEEREGCAGEGRCSRRRG